MSGHYLKSEITESVFIDHPQKTAAILNQIKQLNVQICLDDFGTGYSSFSYLHQFPIDIVKIDRSFIQDIDTNAEKLAIVRAILGLCHTLSMAVTAEDIAPQQRVFCLIWAVSMARATCLLSPPMAILLVLGWLALALEDYPGSVTTYDRIAFILQIL